jgi:hypothetical protein
MNRSQLASWVLVGVFACGCAAAAETLAPSLRACMSESDASKRLACFDRESARLANGSASAVRQAETSQPSAPASATAPASAAPAAAVTAASAAEKSPQEKFGYRGNLARAEQTEAERIAAEQLSATITELSTIGHGELVLTLDNGQVWQQKASDRAIRIKVGDRVTIKRSSLNSFLLTSEAKGVKGSMRVTRVK